VDIDPTIVEPTTEPSLDAPSSEPVELVEDELLVEEISIDGMCGVY
jgi:mycofactocin precursor